MAQLILEESGYIDMWKADRTADAAGRLENLKELTRSMEEFPSLAAFLEHVSLVMDVESGEAGERVSIMTLHAAKGLEFDVVFLPGWEEGLFPHQRSLDENGRAGLEEERRLAYVGLTRARRQAKIYFAANRRIRGLWQTTAPRASSTNCRRLMSRSSRPRARRRMAAMASRASIASSRFLPLMKRRAGGAPRSRRRAAASPNGRRPDSRHGPTLIEGKASARSHVESGLAKGARVFHIKFGPGSVVARRRRQTDGRFRQSRPQDGAGKLRSAGGVGRGSPPQASFLPGLNRGGRRDTGDSLTLGRLCANSGKAKGLGGENGVRRLRGASDSGLT